MFTGSSHWDRVGMTLTRLRTGLRAGLALLLGLPIAFYGALHVVALSKDGFSVHDALGSLPLLLGLTLLAVAIALPWRHRGEGSWKSRLVAVPGVPGRRAVIVLDADVHGDLRDAQVARRRRPARRARPTAT